MWLSSTVRVEIHGIRIMTRKQMIQLSAFCLWPHLYSISPQILFHIGSIFCVFYPRSYFGRIFEAIPLLTIPHIKVIEQYNQSNHETNFPIVYGKINYTLCLYFCDKTLSCAQIRKWPFCLSQQTAMTATWSLVVTVETWYGVGIELLAHTVGDLHGTRHLPVFQHVL